MKSFFTLIVMCCICITAHAQYDNVKKGEIIDINGVKAIVFETYGNGHGRALAAKAIRGKEKLWCVNKEHLPLLDMTNENGAINTQQIYNYCMENRIPVSNFPLFEWCQELGEGWYIPSSKELESFVDFYFGNDQALDWEEDEEMEAAEELSPKIINEKILSAGGYPFSGAIFAGSIHAGGIATSSRNEKGEIFVYQYNEKKKIFQFKEVAPSKLGKYVIGRAFYDF